MLNDIRSLESLRTPRQPLRDIQSLYFFLLLISSGWVPHHMMSGLDKDWSIEKIQVR